MEKDLIIQGVRIGEYDIDLNKVKDMIWEKCVSRGMNFVKISVPHDTMLPKEQFMDWIHYMVENKVYFSICYEVGRGKRRGNVKHPMPCTMETLREVQKYAGEYFLGLSVGGELTTEYACVGNGYWPNCNHAENLTDAAANICNIVRGFVEEANDSGAIPTTSVEQTSLSSYAFKQGFTYPTLETLVGNPEVMIPMVRGVAKVINAPMWSTYIAHEWYGGVRELDKLKMKRLKLVYDYSYMSGSNMFVLESGDECLYAHDTNEMNYWVEGVKSPYDTIYNYDHPVCKEYRDTLDAFSAFVKTDARPKGGPKVSVAFVQGNLDGYSDWRCGSSLWGCYENEEFGYSTPEFVWRVLDEVGRKRNWADVHNFGDVDLSGAPAYGTYDIINATDGYETFSRYDYLIFTGWNTMTQEIYDNLVKFVRGGGRLFMTAAHLNTSDRRNGEIKLINDGDVSELFGCKLDANNISRLNHGYKFIPSIVPEYLYPADLYFDPLFSEGYVNYPEVTLCGAQGTGILSETFWDKNTEGCKVWLTENKVGNGYAVLMANLDYPSANGYTVYKNIVREILTASHRQARIKVYGGDKLRFTVYEGDKIYLLNTDFNCKTHAVIDYGDEKREFILEPCELKIVDR